MSAELTPELCVDVAEALGLPHPGLVEKDYHVVRTLAALASIDHDGVRLAFGGGTSLCRAYRLIERMSEDIDLRIVSEQPLTEGGRRKFRAVVSDRLREAGFAFNPDDPAQLGVHDGGKTFVYDLPYAQVSSSVASLRPGVKVEVSSWPLHRNAVLREVSSFVAQALEVSAEIAAIPCVDVSETAVDKFVALTRRIGEEQHTGCDRDRTLLRHVYDLYCIRPCFELGDLRSMIQTVMESDRRTRSRKFPAYAENPQRVSREAIQILAQDGNYAREFEVFQRDMVYGPHVLLSECLPVLREFAELL